MKQRISNLVLIGMPGAGKSTVGVMLAEKTNRHFVDTDALIEKAQGRSLQDIVDKDGYLELRRIEETALLEISVQDHVISTGGSAVYSSAAMDHLKIGATAVFLDVSLETLEERIPNFSTRGLAKRPNQSFSELFEERNGLYRKFADVTVKCDGLTADEVCDRIIAATS
ncbi:MAG TPA: shikimate kinase [Rhodocyclaceae bacterium]|nr:shikimate kinase [Rhodocyclaceae bacterium]